MIAVIADHAASLVATDYQAAGTGSELVISYNTRNSDGLGKFGKCNPLNKRCLFAKGLQWKKLSIASCDSLA